MFFGPKNGYKTKQFVLFLRKILDPKTVVALIFFATFMSDQNDIISQLYSYEIKHRC